MQLNEIKVVKLRESSIEVTKISDMSLYGFSYLNISSLVDIQVGEYLSNFWREKFGSIKILPRVEIRYSATGAGGHGTLSHAHIVRKDPITVFKVKNATVLTRNLHLLLDSDVTVMERFAPTEDEFYKFIMRYGRFFHFSTDSFAFSIKDLPPLSERNRVVVNQIDGSSVASFTPILVSNHTHDSVFTHWIAGIVRGLYHAKEVLQKVPNPVLVFTYHPAPWQIESISYILREVELKYTVIETPTIFESILFISVGGDTFYDNPFYLHLFSLREKIPNGRRIKIFIERSSSSGRNIVNQRQLNSVLARQGFHVVRLENYSFADQVILFSNASVVCFVSGSSGMNLAFSESDTKVGIITWSEEDNEWQAIASNFGLFDCHLFSAEAVFKTNGFFDLQIDCHRFDQFIRETLL
jgi:hypothetical protein